MSKAIYKAINSVIIGDVLFKPGQILPWGDLSEKDRKTLLRDRDARPVGAVAEEDAPADPNLKLRNVESPDGEMRPEMSAEAPPPPPRAPGLWNCDPNVLQGKTLEQLQVMISERDPNRAPPISEQECIAVLSQDWVG